MNIINTISQMSIPLIIIGILIFGIIKKINIFESFVKGAKDGLNITYSILPSLIGLLAAISVFQASGALDFLNKILSPIAKAFKLPSQVIPLVLLRPLSGSASLAFLSELFATHGVDSYIAITASTIMGCSETILYTVAIYLSCSKITKSRFSIPLALFISIIGFFISSMICKFFS